MSQFDIDLLRQINALERRIEALERVEYAPGGSIVAARYTSDAGQSITNGTYTIVNFEDQDYDTHSAVTVGASWKFTAPEAGYYHVAATIHYSSTTAWGEGEFAIIRIYKNGTADLFLHQLTGLDSSGAAAIKGVNGATTLQLAANDYIDLRTYQNSGGTLTLVNSGQYVYVSIERVG